MVKWPRRAPTWRSERHASSAVGERATVRSPRQERVIESYSVMARLALAGSACIGVDRRRLEFFFAHAQHLDVATFLAGRLSLRSGSHPPQKASCPHAALALRAAMQPPRRRLVASGQCPVRVIFVGSTRSGRARHVRFAPIASEIRHRSESTWCANRDLTHCSKSTAIRSPRRRGRAVWAARRDRAPSRS
jgi:hypothetical protein